MSDSIIYLSGNFIEESKAAISPINRGLMYGDGLFETFRGYKGEIFALKNHYKRLTESARFLKMEIPFTERELSVILFTLLEKNDLLHADSRIRLTVIRGGSPSWLLPSGKEGSTVIISSESVPASIEAIQQKGIKLSLLKSFKIDHLSPLASRKTINYIPGILGMMEIKERGGDEGIYLNYEGHAVEGITSNIFIVKDNKLYTPPLSSGLLPGITRDIVLEVAPLSGIDGEEKDLSCDEIFQAEEIFITSSVREVVPAIGVDEKKFAIGPLTRKIQKGYKKFVAAYLSDIDKMSASE
ncbi:MAG: aminotransferase class IV [Deltaproteobacteria bacterium]|nr:aminotransferase class IV [Deltaproteobacteria bacterium]